MVFSTVFAKPQTGSKVGHSITIIHGFIHLIKILDISKNDPNIFLHRILQASS